LLRIAFAVQAASTIVQPVLAGQYLAGDFDALTTHAINAGLVYLGSIAAFIAAVLYWLVGRGAGWPAAVMAAMFVAINAQTAFGALRLLALHIPLGVAIVATAVALAVWSFRPAALRRRWRPQVRERYRGVAR
jgi:glucan phosphoethanolaminetransferase (alkaline phosphatase superfamily)